MVAIRRIIGGDNFSPDRMAYHIKFAIDNPALTPEVSPQEMKALSEGGGNVQLVVVDG